MTEFQPRYTAYAKAHGKTAAQALRDDKKEWPCACMYPFMTWIQGKWHEWRKANKLTRDSVLSAEQIQQFDAFIGAA